MDTLSNTLLKEIAASNRDAFRIFYNKTYVSLYRFVSYFLFLKEDREEVVSDVYCIIWARREKLLEIDNLKSYMFITARNESFRVSKAKSKQAVSIDNMPIEISIKSNTAHDDLVEDELLNIYSKAVTNLPERCKLVYLMVREEKMKHREVAEILSITQGTVEQQMNIAIKRIVDTVKEHYPSLPLKPNMYVARK